MAFRTNYRFERSERDRLKKAKKDEKLKRQQERVVSRRDDGSYVFSCTLITVPANSLLAQVHNAKQRMPAILDEAHYDTWLNAAPAAAHELLTPYPAQRMSAWEVGRRVNNPRFENDASLIAPA